MTGKTWCPLPWMSINVRNNGDLRVCCNANVGFDQGLVRKDDNTIFNLGKDNLNDIRNAQLLKDIRKSMLNDEFHPSCVRCKREEESGMETRMHWERDLWMHILDEQKIRKLTADDGSINVDEIPIAYMDLRFGNLCNLKCRMCGPTDSNQWYDDTVRLYGNSYRDSDQTIILIKNQKGRYEPNSSIYNWYENPKFWSSMENNIPTIERLYIVGGEPLLIDQHYDFLQKCIDMNHSNRIIVEYNSNITNIPQRAFDIWKHFKNIRIGMSVDAVGPLNDYIRNPSKWKKIQENMFRLDTADGNFTLWWTATIQVYNMIHLPEMMIWKIKQDFKRINRHYKNKPIISPHPLHNPPFLNVKIFPEESKKWISSYFDDWKNRAKIAIYDDIPHLSEEKDNNYKWFCNILDHYVNYMNAEDHSHLLEKFWRYTKALDKSRSESLKTVCYQTWNLLNGGIHDA